MKKYLLISDFLKKYKTKLHFLRVLRYHLRYGKSYGYIFMLHRVDEFEEGHLWPNEHMKVTPDFLDTLLAKLKQKYEVIRFSDVPDYLAKKKTKKFICFTMDDGYKDNLTNALPIFKKHNIPYTIFLTTNFPDYKAILWWYELEDLLLNNTSIKLSNGFIYEAETYEQKCRAFLNIREEILKLNQLNLEEELNKLFSDYSINWSKKCSEMCLSWDDVNILVKEPLVDIGAHTCNHYNLKRLETIEAVKEEICSSCDIIQKRTNYTPKVFAYPFGSLNEVGEREKQVLDSMDFLATCIAEGGACNKVNSKRKSALPRVMLTNAFSLRDLL